MIYILVIYYQNKTKKAMGGMKILNVAQMYTT